MKIEILSPSNVQQESAQPSDEGLFVDFNDQYHVVRRAWGDRKINVASLSEYFCAVSYRCAFLKSPDLEKVRPFSTILNNLGFTQFIIYDAPRWAHCSVLLATVVTEWVLKGGLVSHIISSDSHLDECVPGARYSFAEGLGNVHILPPTLLTPIPVTDRLEFEYDTTLSD